MPWTSLLGSKDRDNIDDNNENDNNGNDDDNDKCL